MTVERERERELRKRCRLDVQRRKVMIGGDGSSVVGVRWLEVLGQNCWRIRRVRRLRKSHKIYSNNEELREM
jgi:hypothetical protein